MWRTHRSTLAAMLLAADLVAASLARAQEEPAPRLDPPNAAIVGEAGSSTYRAHGVDPAAPRRLVLWRRIGEDFVRLASTRSQRDGRFDFGVQPLPSSSVYFHVGLEGDRPDPARLVHVERRVAAPVVLAGAPDGGEIVLVPAEPGGELRFYDASTGRLLWRIPAEPELLGPIDLREALPGRWPAGLSIEQVLGDGRRSARSHWRID